MTCCDFYEKKKKMTVSFFSCNFPHIYTKNFRKKMKCKKNIVYLENVTIGTEKVEFLSQISEKPSENKGKNVKNFHFFIFPSRLSIFFPRQKLPVFFFFPSKLPVFFLLFVKTFHFFLLPMVFLIFNFMCEQW